MRAFFPEKSSAGAEGLQEMQTPMLPEVTLCRNGVATPAQKEPGA